MGYSDSWKILEEIVIEFRKRGITVPEKVMTDLRSAKTMIKLMETVDRDRGEISLKLEQYLTSLEGYLITEAQKVFPPERIDDWLQRLDKPACDACTSTVQTKEETRFISGVPRDQKWVRVKPISGLPIEKLETLANESNLSCMHDKEGHLVVYGKAENIKEFVKKMTEQTIKE